MRPVEDIRDSIAEEGRSPESMGKAILSTAETVSLRLPLSAMQAEYATDMSFHRQADFQPLYDNIV